ncbi:MMPL family transporter [Candidatus Saccharibacteria bacterium]|nr:MMPL family transporter [Candidatus Saccharibacteria bacterium]
MKKFYELIVEHRKSIVIGFIITAVVCFFLKGLVGVNYDITDYLPDDSPSTQALDVMKKEFPDGIPNARVMVKDVSIPEALEMKDELSKIDGVESVTWMDDSVDITMPLEMLDTEVIETYYKNNTALYSLTIDEEKDAETVAKVREVIGEDNALTGSVVNTADGRTNTVAEVDLITIVAVLFVLAVLTLSTDSWVEPIVVLAGLGVAILINGGTNLMFGTVSFVTNAAGSVLQLAVSLDYSVFLIHRFEEMKRKESDPKKAMTVALSKSTMSILSSGLTTVIGFLAVILMRFKIGPDVGLSLAKGVVISLITTFVFMPGLILLTYKIMEKTKHRSLLPSFKLFGKGIGKITMPLVICFVMMIVPGFLAYNSNSYYYGASKLFNESSRIGRDNTLVEETFGENDTYALMVKSGDRVKEKELSDDLHKLPEVTSIISYVDTVGSTIPNSYLDSKTYSKLDSGNYTRMVISVSAPYEGEDTFHLVETIRGLGEKYYPGEGGYYLAGNGVSTYDLKDTITADMMKVNVVAIAAVFIVLLFSLKSMLVPLILILAIETAIALNLSFPYFQDEVVFYVAYLIISSIQLGATVDYAILTTDRYRENRQTLDKKQAVSQTITDVTPSILVSGGVLTMVGFLMGWVSSNQLLAQLGIFIGRGALLSLLIVMLVLPGLLSVLDGIVTGRRGFGRIKSMREKRVENRK